MINIPIPIFGLLILGAVLAFVYIFIVVPQLHRSNQNINNILDRSMDNMKRLTNNMEQMYRVLKEILNAANRKNGDQ